MKEKLEENEKILKAEIFSASAARAISPMRLPIPTPKISINKISHLSRASKSQNESNSKEEGRKRRK
jgi:hypothetical protein